MLATASKPYFQRVSRQMLFLRTLIAGAVYCIAIQTAAGATTATEPAAGGRARGDRRYRDPARGEHQPGADQRHGVQPGNDRSEGHQGLPGHRALHPGRVHRHLGHQRDLASAASPRRGAPARPASISTTRPSRCARSASIPTTPCRRPSTWIASRCCAGPQGTLFGAGSEGGTVRYIMTQPSVTQESTYAQERGLLHPRR